ncbi:putative membrane protein [Crossiella equi]|uniref:Membrane protein n=1 Tax=Crossiella equi TaxID=130796 RepID=A0ABS5ADC2_9PSEU|nr:PH domain-containing protein [Crossiella equi]MBP2474312.1 putative membrane protein [Crossiella equi]
MSHEPPYSPLTGYPPMPEAPAEPVVEQDWRRLDTRTVVVAPLSEISGLVGVAFVLLVIRGFSGLRWWEIGGGTAVALALVVFGVIRWYTTRYRVTSTHVELHTGLLFKKERSVARDRLRTVDATSDVFHRLFGLSVVKIGTGRQDQGEDDELTLDAIGNAEAERLRGQLLRRVPARPAEAPATTVVGDSGADAVPGGVAEVPAEGQPEVVLSELDTRWLRFAPFTLFGIIAVGAIAAAVGWLSRTFDLDLLHNPAVGWLFHWVRDTPVLIVVAVALGILLVLSTVGSLVVYVLQYWNYKLSRRDDGTLHVAYGLLTLRSVTIEEARVRGVEVHEQLLLRTVRGATAKAIATGLGTGQDSGTLLPPAPMAEARWVTAQVLGTDASPTAEPLRRHPRAARRRLLLWNLVGFAVPAVALGVLAWQDVLPHWPWQAALVLLPVGLVIGWDEYRNLGHTLTEKYLVSRSGSVVRNTVVLQRTGIIGWRIRQSLFQRRAGVLTVGATSATGTGLYDVKYVGVHDGLALAEETVPELLTPFLERG